jgi:hypothetical protein
MRSYDAGTIAQIQARNGLVTRRLVHIKARNLSTDQIEPLGLWSDDYNLSITLEGEARTYLGVGALLEAEPITAGTGLQVRNHQLKMAAIAPEVEDLVKGYNTRFAPVEIHRALLGPQSHNLVGVPHRVFRGMIDEIDFPDVPEGEAATCTIAIVSETRALTKTLASKKSHDSYQNGGGDNFRQYGDISGAIPLYWGEKQA